MEANASADRGEVRLYSPAGVCIAAFVGSVLAGAILLARNYEAMGNDSAARKARWWGAAGLVAMSLVALALPSLPNGAFAGVPVAMLFLAKNLQGKDYEAHVAAGGAAASNWKALGAGLLWLVPSLLVLLATALTMRLIGTAFGF